MEPSKKVIPEMQVIFTVKREKPGHNSQEGDTEEVISQITQ